MEDIRQLIYTQNLLLRELIETLKEQKSDRSNQPQLGFGEVPYARTINANRNHNDCLWYFWNGGKQEHEPITQNAITAVIEKLEFKEGEYKGKPDYKIRTHIKADRNYVIQSGWDSLFTKGLLYTLSRLPVHAFKTPLTIAVRAGNDEQVLFCDIYKPSGERIYCPYDESVDWNQVFDRASKKLEQAHGSTSTNGATPQPASVGASDDDDGF